MRITRLVGLAALLVFPTSAEAQRSLLNGKVLGPDYRPVAGASVEAVARAGTERVQSDAEGVFTLGKSIDIKNGESIRIRITKAGYQVREHVSTGGSIFLILEAAATASTPTMPPRPGTSGPAPPVPEPRGGGTVTPPKTPNDEEITSSLNNALEQLAFDTTGKAINARRVAGELREGPTGEEKIGRLLSERLIVDLPDDLKKRTLALLGHFDCRCATALTTYFRTENESSLRSLIVEAALALGARDSLSVLTVLTLDDDTPEIRRKALAAAVEQHGQTLPVEVAALLKRTLAKERDEYVRQLALRSLETLDPPGVVAFAEHDLVNHSSQYVRALAAEILANRGPLDHARALVGVFTRRGLTDHTYKRALTTYVRRFGYEKVNQILAGLAPEHIGSCSGKRYLTRSNRMSASPGTSLDGRLIVAGTEAACVTFVGDHVLLRKDAETGWFSSDNVTTEDPRTFFEAAGAGVKGYLVAGLLSDGNGGNLGEVTLNDGRTVAIRSILEVTVGSDSRLTLKTQAGDVSGTATYSGYGSSSDLCLVGDTGRMRLSQQKNLKLVRTPR